MRSFSWLFLFCSLAVNASATTRAPKNASEKSLLYWRYLCQGQAQTDVVRAKNREFSCLGQGWKVVASQDDSLVKEVVENGDR